MLNNLINSNFWCFLGEFDPPKQQSASFLIGCNYLNYRLSKEGYVWDVCPKIPDELIPKCEVMRRLGELCEKRFHKEKKQLDKKSLIKQIFRHI